MLNGKARRMSAFVLLAGAVAMPLAGCETVQKETGLGQETQIGALGGAALGGIIAALADANPAWIAASIILGGVAGGLLGNELGKDSAEKHAQTNLNALETLGAGQSASWSDTKSGNSGSTTVNRVFTQADGRTCKAYTETIRTTSRTVTQDGTACKDASGGWKVQKA